MDKGVYAECAVENRCELAKAINSIEVRSIYNQLPLCNAAYDVVKTIGLDGSNGLEIEGLNTIGRYKVWAGGYSDFGCVINGRGGEVKRQYYSEGDTMATQMCCIDLRECGGAVEYSNGDIKNEDVPKTYKLVYASDNETQARAFMSLLDSKLVKFMVLYQISSYGNILNNNTFRYVPDISKLPLDHEYSNSEVYKVYGIGDELANIIERTIRARKGR